MGIKEVFSTNYISIVEKTINSIQSEDIRVEKEAWIEKIKNKIISGIGGKKWPTGDEDLIINFIPPYTRFFLKKQ